MEEHSNSGSGSYIGRVGSLFASVENFVRRCIFRILSLGPIPNHVSFIMDGNRRYAKKENLEEGAGHRAGYLALMSILKYCYELRIKYVSIYAFSIDNFRRQPDEVHKLMDLMLEKIEALLKEESLINQYGVRVYFIGNLKLLNEPVRVAAEKVMRATANNNKYVLLVCVAYTSCDEIVHAVQESCMEKLKEIQPYNSHTTYNVGIEEIDGEAIVADGVHEADESLVTTVSDTCRSCDKGVDEKKNGMVVRAVVGSCVDKREEANSFKASRTSNGVIAVEEYEKMEGMHSIIKLVDVEKHMYMAVAPDPDIIIRSSGETRLSNFLLWQSSNCMLYSPNALWPEIGVWHLLWAILDFQRHYTYLEKKKKQI